jgi:phage protein D
MELQRPQIKVLYNSKDITNDISKYIVGLKYTDNTEGSSDSIELNLEDIDGLWRDGWYPDKGDELTVSIGYNGVFLDCGVFEIDQIQLRGTPDMVSLQGLGAGIKGDIRTKISAAHENKTLRQLAEAVASRHNLSIIGGVAPIVIERVTQREETDLSFLNRIGHEYGYIFSIRGSQLIWTSIFDIEELAAVASIDRTDMMSYDITDKTLQTYSSASVKYHNPVNKTVSTYEVEKINNKDDVPFNYIKSGDTLKIYTKAENNQQAEAKAKAALYRANSLQQEGTVVVPGNAYLVAGNNFEITGLGKISGIFHIMSSEHSIDRSGGWTTTLDIKRVGFVIKQNQKSKKPKKPVKYTVTVVK